MANDRIDTMLASNHEQQPELMLSNVLHLMSHYHANAACPKLASVIERHLRVLSSLPSLAPVLQATCQQLSQQWAAMVTARTAALLSGPSGAVFRSGLAMASAVPLIK